MNKLEKAFKKDNVFGGVAHVSSNSTSPGVIQHVGKIKRLSFGKKQLCVLNNVKILCGKLSKEKLIEKKLLLNSFKKCEEYINETSVELFLNCSDKNDKKK